MVSRTERTLFAEWWWTIDRLMLAAIGIAAMWREIGKRWNAVAAGILTAVLMAPMVVADLKLGWF